MLNTDLFGGRHYLAIIESSDDAIISKTLDGIITSWNPAAQRIFGYTREEAVGSPMLMLFPSDRKSEESQILAKIGLGEKIEHFETVRITKAGRRIDVSVTISPLKNEEGQIVGASNIARDITSRRQAERQIELMATVFQRSGEAIMITDSFNRFVSVNAAFTRLTGYTLDDVRNENPKILSGGNTPPETYQIMWDTLLREGYWEGELLGQTKGGILYYKRLSISVVRNDLGKIENYIASFSDITDQRRAEESSVWRATHDALTGLSNRDLLGVQLANALQRAERDKATVALIDIDLDGFKLINETHGHGAGDAVLKSVGSRISSLVRQGDIVARVAGDEFLVLCERVDQPIAISMKAEQIAQALREPIEYQGVSLSVSASIGIAIGSGSTHSVDEMFRSADSARNAVKERGGNAWHFSNDELEQKFRQRLAVMRGLHTAIERNEFSCRFQPIVSSRDRRIVGAELLLRWHPPTGEISPGVFIPIAESTNIIIPIGKWVFRQACIKEVEWRELWGPSALQYISVNVSTRQLSEKTLAREFADMMRETGADPSRMLIEITETSLMTDVEANLQVLNELAAIGLRVAIDDFGTGYSSLAQLTRLPVSVLKIDKAFVDGVENNAESRKVINSIMGLGRSLGLKLVAEGVENDSQFMELRSKGCDFIQGYACYRPLDAGAFEKAMYQNLADDGGAVEPHYFLIYVSEADPSITEADAQEISRIASIHNEGIGITGCLLYLDGWFMQMIEGRREQVLNLAEKIKADRRHHNFKIAIQGQAVSRVFDDWGMAFQVHSAVKEVTGIDWQDNKKVRLLEIAKDSRLCYFFITAFKSAIALNEL